MGRVARAVHLTLVALLGIGFLRALAHRSEAPLLLGRYSLAYVAVLLGWLGLWALLILLSVRPFRVWLGAHRRLLRGLGGALLAFVVLELGVRLVLGLTDRPVNLWHGREHFSILMRQVTHGGQRPAYYKYGPNLTVPQEALDPRIRSRINNLGFRGHDVSLDKPAGVFRIVALGESSTFGYGSREGWTYPDQLERELGARAPGLRVEVVNLGMAHDDSDNMVAIVRSEALRLRPDVVTLYAGANDTIFLDSALRSPFFQQLEQLSAFLDRFSLAKQQTSIWAGRLVGPRLYPEPFLRGVAAKAARRYIGNVERIRDMCEKSDARLVLVTQQFTSAAERSELGDLRRMSYQQERDALSDFARARGGLNWKWGAMFYIHARLMDELHTYAPAHGLPLVDGIAALDPTRARTLITWADLSEEGNGILAGAIAEALVPLLPRP